MVGGGGKTSLIDRLARELSENARVLRMTTTHIYPPEDVVICAQSVDEALLKRVEAALDERTLVTVGRAAPRGKLTAPLGALEELFALADYVLLEADGSRGMPFKAPDEREPALSGREGLVLAVAGASGFGLPIWQASHRA